MEVDKVWAICDRCVFICSSIMRQYCAFEHTHKLITAFSLDMGGKRPNWIIKYQCSKP